MQPLLPPGVTASQTSGTTEAHTTDACSQLDHLPYLPDQLCRVVLDQLHMHEGGTEFRLLATCQGHLVKARCSHHNHASTSCLHSPQCSPNVQDAGGLVTISAAASSRATSVVRTHGLVLALWLLPFGVGGGRRSHPGGPHGCLTAAVSPPLKAADRQLVFDSG